MSIVEYKTSLLKLILDFNSEKRWEVYMKTIDDEIQFLIEWEKNIKNRHKQVFNKNLIGKKTNYGTDKRKHCNLSANKKFA